MNQAWRIGWLGLLLAAGCCAANSVYALDPARTLSQYKHEQWSAEQGFPGGPVYALAQTPDGYLWIGAEQGLVQYDGLSFRLLQTSALPGLPAGPVLGLATDADGNLWIRLRKPSLVRYRAGKFENVLGTLAQPEPGVTAMTQGANGELLFSALVNGTLRYKNGKLVPLMSASVRPNFLVISMAETLAGDIWLGTRDAGLFRFNGARHDTFTKGLPDQKINCLLPVENGELWIGTDRGVVRWNGTQLTQAGLPAALTHIQALTLTRDRDANIWVGTNSHGLLRFNAQGVAAFAEGAQGTSKAVTAVFEDREGNLWIGSANGLERLREGAFVAYPTSADLPAEKNGPLYVEAETRVWFAPQAGGLHWLKQDGQRGQITVAGLDKDVVYALAGGHDELWIGRQRGGLTQLRLRGGVPSAVTYTQTDGLAQNSVYAVCRARDDSIWAGTLNGGVSHFSGGKFTTYTQAQGLASNTVTALLESADGTLWVATPKGLSAWSSGQWRTYTSSEGLPSEAVNCLSEDALGVLWVGTAAGLAAFHAGRFQALPARPAVLQEPILGIAADQQGALWLATANHVLRFKCDELHSGTLGETELREFGLADGLPGVEGVKRFQSVVADSAGRIWFSLNRGLAMADPARLTKNAAPVLVHLQTITADGRALDLTAPLRIPAARQRLIFGFAGLSLSLPERVKFRYKLDGFEHDWNETTTTREAPYTNLGPGFYRFRVNASNADGRWNATEAVLAFQIEPLFWQSWWFRLLLVLAGGLLLLALYQLRLRQLKRQMNILFEERLAERTRIAQDLHDTLLQSCISASMQLHVAVDQLPAGSPAKPLLGRVVQLMGQVIEESRNAVRELRSVPGNAPDLEQSFARLPQELAWQEPVDFRVIVEGRPRNLHPILRDEVYRIGREALVNAFRHARATLIEVELEYQHSHLRILVRDDGCGIDPQVLRTGRAGHWGLTGMRERAERLGARLQVRSRADAGTEVELFVPSQIAFLSPPAARLSAWFTHWYRRSTKQKSVTRRGRINE